LAGALVTGILMGTTSGRPFSTSWDSKQTNF
jgi:hypothetical protein